MFNHNLKIKSSGINSRITSLLGGFKILWCDQKKSSIWQSYLADVNWYFPTDLFLIAFLFFFYISKRHFMIAETWCGALLHCPQNKINYSVILTMRGHWLIIFFNISSQNTEEKGESDDGSDASKSEISLVYEIALKRNLCVNFEVRCS